MVDSYEELRWRKRRATVEEVAVGCLRELGLEEPGEELEAIAAFKEAPVRYAPLDGIHGALVERASGKEILVSERLHQNRQRWAIAHELGHLHLHAGLSQMFLCTETQMTQFYRNSTAEREAQWFAACMLIPPASGGPVVRRGRPSIRTAQSLSERFGVSLTAAALRICELWDGACAVVLSSRNGVLWWQRSLAFPFVIDTRFKALNTETHAYDALFRRAEAPTYPSSVAPSAWLYFEPHGVELKESALLLGETGFCLSVLAIPGG